MKIRSSFKDYIYYFDFFVDSVDINENELSAKVAKVKTAVFTSDKSLLWEGYIHVRWNLTGIYPDAKDVNKADVPTVVKRMLLIEIRRYIKPQRNFL